MKKNTDLETGGIIVFDFFNTVSILQLNVWIQLFAYFLLLSSSLSFFGINTTPFIFLSSLFIFFVYNGFKDNKSALLLDVKNNAFVLEESFKYCFTKKENKFFLETSELSYVEVCKNVLCKKTILDKLYLFRLGKNRYVYSFVFFKKSLEPQECFSSILLQEECDELMDSFRGCGVLVKNC